MNAFECPRKSWWLTTWKSQDSGKPELNRRTLSPNTTKWVKVVYCLNRKAKVVWSDPLTQKKKKCPNPAPFMAKVFSQHGNYVKHPAPTRQPWGVHRWVCPGESTSAASEVESEARVPNLGNKRWIKIKYSKWKI